MKRADKMAEQAATGDQQATRELFQVVYDDLRRVAGAKLAGESPGQTLTATALVHEAFVKLSPEALWNDPAHLFRTAAKVMRQILIDTARRKQSLKHGGFLDRQDSSSNQIAARRDAIDPVEFDEAIGKLEAANSHASMVFQMRYYGGRTWEAIAQELGISVEKTEALWSYARAKLAQSLSAH